MRDLELSESQMHRPKVFSALRNQGGLSRPKKKGLVLPNRLYSRETTQNIYHSIQNHYRQTSFLRAVNFQLQIQNLAARRINFHHRDRCVEMLAEKLSLQIQLLPITDTDFVLKTNKFCNRSRLQLYTPESFPGACAGALRTALVSRFGLPTLDRPALNRTRALQYVRHHNRTSVRLEMELPRSRQLPSAADQ